MCNLQSMSAIHRMLTDDDRPMINSSTFEPTVKEHVVIIRAGRRLLIVENLLERKTATAAASATAR